MKSRSNLPQIKEKQALSWARWQEAYLSAKLWNQRYYWLNLVSDEMYNLIVNSDDDWTELAELIKPSQINSCYDSDFQNSQWESISSIIFNKFFNSWNKFGQIDINDFSEELIPRNQLKYALNSWYFEEV